MTITNSIGADPEVFVYNTRRQKFLSAHDMIEGTKKAPHKTPFGAIQVDGVAMEFNIEPAYDLGQFIRGIKAGLNYLIQAAKDDDMDNVIRTDPVAVFEQEYFDALPAEVKQLGCDPDFDAYTGNPNFPPGTTEPFRTGAGHVHFGWFPYGKTTKIDEPEHIEDCVRFVKLLDRSVFAMSLLWDTDTKRRTLYGRRGTFRPKTYGMEYRVLSNKWLSDTRLISWVYLASRYCLELDSEEYTLAKTIMDDIIAEENPPRALLLKGYKFLTEKMGFPHLPQVYIDKAKHGI